jgi:thiol-disulfide isomerase/thioredoxin
MSSFFSSSRHVKELTPADFDDMEVWKLRSKGCTAVLFYAPGCGWCQKVKGTWEEFGKMAKFCDVVAMDAMANSEHMSKIKENMPHLVKGFPTIVFYKRGSPKTTYAGDRSLADLLAFGTRECSAKD